MLLARQTKFYMRSAGLDNLPNEVAHLLQEIKEKEIKAQGTRRILHARA
jgi:hypothetical protein